jgi:hypothetical protein
MYTAKDGKNFGNIEQGKHYDKTRPKEAAADGTQPGNPDSESHADDGNFGDVIEEHGPAKHTHIVAEEDGTHTVHSHHEDGHHHASKGHDLESAHKHSMHAHSGEEPEAEPFKGEETPEEEEAEENASIPTMKA